MLTKPWVKIGLIFPDGRDIMIEADTEEAYRVALEVVSQTEEFLQFGGQTESGTNWVPDKKYFQRWIDVKSNVKMADFIPRLAELLRAEFKQRDILADVVI